MALNLDLIYLFIVIALKFDLPSQLMLLYIVPYDCLTNFKQDTSNGWRSCDVWGGRMIMSKPISYACNIASKVT